MKKPILFIFLSLSVLILHAQNYLINFSGTGSSTTVETVTVENLTQGKSITFAGSKTLHLMDKVTGNTPLLEYIDYPMIVYPNPSSGDFQVQFEAQKSGMVTVAIYDISGREINEQQQRIKSGFQSFKIDGLGNGVFTIQVLLEDRKFTQKVVCNGKTNSNVSITYNGLSEVNQNKTTLKNASIEQTWQYNEGDRLKFQGTSGKYSTIVMDVPTQSKTLSFDFVECADADGNNYPVVKIGNQLWMAENLRTTKYRTGDVIPQIYDDKDWDSLNSLNIGGYCWYQNNANNIKFFGALYQYSTVTDTLKIAPIGWHIPTSEEWKTLIAYLDGNSAGNKLKESGKTHWEQPIQAGTNESGYSAGPGGYRYSGFWGIGHEGYWWSSTESSTSDAYRVGLIINDPSCQITTINKLYGLSVRCIKGDIPQLATIAPYNNNSTSVTTGGNITDNGDSPILEQGVCWSIFQNPTILDNKIIDKSSSSSFTSAINGLNEESCYYIRAYAKNAYGTGYGNQVTTLCPEIYSSKTSTININIPGISDDNLNTGVNGSISGTVVYMKDGVENMIITPTLFFNEPLIPAIHLIKKEDSWVYGDNYSSGSMGCARNYDFLDDRGTIVFSDTGLELKEGTWPMGNLMVARTIGDKLSWSTVSNDRSFYHSVSTGDINNDGLKDIVGLHMGTKGSWTNDNLHTYTQNADGTFSENRDIISLSKVTENYGGGAVLVADVLGDSRPEIIKADYGQNPTYPSPRYSFAIFSFDQNTGHYELVKSPGPLGVFENPDRGATSIKEADFDNDGDLDLAVATEGTDFNGIEIWLNDGAGNFTPSDQKIEFSPIDLQFREFQVMDIDNDGYLDIVLNPFHYGKLFRIDAESSDLDKTEGIILNNLIWKNSTGKFSLLKKDIIVYGVIPEFVKGFKINGKLTFFCVRGNANSSITITEIVPHL
ncbi:FISUMP domain-containing protein [Aquipluma nitroreducens]|nr:FISUMP domain-containing protein [Aquipluma nitroreducens]